MKNNTNNNSGGSHSRVALVYMMIHVIVSSFVVFVIDWGETNKYPFFFSALHNIFALCVFLFIAIIWR